jgi:hypothetical protein
MRKIKISKWKSKKKRKAACCPGENRTCVRATKRDGKSKEVMLKICETITRPKNIKTTNKNIFCAEQSEIDYSSDKTRIIGKKDSFADYSKRSLSHCHFIPMYELKSNLEDIVYKISKRIIFIAKTIKCYLGKKKSIKLVKIKNKVISFQIIKNKNRYLSLKAALISLSDSSMLLTLQDIGSTHEELRKRFINEYLFFKLSLLAAWVIFFSDRSS